MATSKTTRITRTRALELLSQHRASGGGKFFSVLFKKRGDGQDRRMQARFAVKKGVQGTGTFTTEQKAAQGLITVYEVGADGGFRNIPVEGLKELTIGGVHYVITTPTSA
jgi:hypothetical protein